MNRNIITISNTGRAIHNIDKFVEVGAADRAVLGMLPYGNIRKMALYDNKEQCRFVLGLLVSAMINDDDYFEFPRPEDLQERMEVARQHRSKVTSRKVSHGGS